MLEQLGKVNIPYALVEAIDGKGITADAPAAYNYFKDQREELPTNNTAYLKSFMLPGGGKNFQVSSSIIDRDMTRGEIGCFLSHCKIYAHILQHKIPLSVILEDDVLLSPDFGDVLLGLKHYYDEYEVIFLGTNYSGYRSLIEEGCPVSLWGKKKVTSATKIGHFVDVPLGSHAYVVSWRGVRCLFSLAMPMSIPLDLMLTLGFYDNRYKITGIKPEAVMIKEDLQKNSAIDGIDIRPMLLVRPPWRDRLEKWLPLLHHFLRVLWRFPRRLRITMLQVFPTWPAQKTKLFQSDEH